MSTAAIRTTIVFSDNNPLNFGSLLFLLIFRTLYVSPSVIFTTTPSIYSREQLNGEQHGVIIAKTSLTDLFSLKYSLGISAAVLNNPVESLACTEDAQNESAAKVPTNNLARIFGFL